MGDSTGVKKGVSESQLSSGSSVGKVRTTVEKVSMKGVKIYITLESNTDQRQSYLRSRSKNMLRYHVAFSPI